MGIIEAKLAKLAARKTAAASALTDDDKAEIEARAKLEADEAETKELERQARQLSVDRRRDKAEEKLGHAHIKSIIPAEYPEHTFIVKAPEGKDYRAWEEGIGAASRDKAARADVNRQLALKCVHDWNGDDDVQNPQNAAGCALAQLFVQKPALATLVSNAASELAGLATEERKS